MAEIRIRNLTVAYGDNVAVRDINVDVSDGELLVLLGPSGCGKTTTMRSVAGLETPQGGSIHIGDTCVFDAGRRVNHPPSQRNVGMVFQSYAIWPHKTVFDNVAFPLRVQRMDRAQIRAKSLEALELVGLQDLAHRGASRLSGGQMQRVALARSLVMSPQALLLDEPLSNLDAKLREKLRFEIKALLQELGITAIYVTHDQDEALALADRIAVMQQGVIEQIGDSVSIYRHPESLFVADFLGSSNQLKGTVSAMGQDGDVLVTLPSGSVVSSTLAASSQALEVGTLIGTEVVCSVRPESPSFLSEGNGARDDDAENCLDGVVSVVNFMGSVTRYQVDIGFGNPLEVVRQERWERPKRPGDPVRLLISRNDIIAYAWSP